jgi:hypothetical protein
MKAVLFAIALACVALVLSVDAQSCCYQKLWVWEGCCGVGGCNIFCCNCDGGCNNGGPDCVPNHYGNRKRSLMQSTSAATSSPKRSIGETFKQVSGGKDCIDLQALEKYADNVKKANPSGASKSTKRYTVADVFKMFDKDGNKCISSKEFVNPDVKVKWSDIAIA